MAKRQDASTGQIVDDGKPDEQSADAGKQTLHVKIYSPYKTYFDEAANSISAVSRTGSFDILPKHHNFITLLEPCTVVVESTHGQVPLKISGGIMHVRHDEVIVFLDA
jgi:F0F1-type ATP synthase epsilon subunit